MSDFFHYLLIFYGMSRKAWGVYQSHGFPILSVLILTLSVCPPAIACKNDLEKLAGVSPQSFDRQELEQANQLLARSPQLSHSKLVSGVVHSNGIGFPEPSHRLALWLRTLEEAKTNPEVHAALREKYINEFAIDETQIPESFFENQVRIAREQGFGDISFSEDKRRELVLALIEDQRGTLQNWFDYLISPNVHAPAWVRAWVLDSVTRMGKIDPESGKFANRGARTIHPFAELNREALAHVLEEATKANQSFAKLYAKHLQQNTANQRDLSVTLGRWVRYPQNSSPEPLVSALQGCNTGWCTAAPATAKSHLAGGDFHVYFSNDKDGKPSVPRIAIRMEGSRIAEVRGIEKEQNLDSHISTTAILSQKLGAFGQEGEKYHQRTSDMAQLTEIGRKHQSGVPLNAAELRFLYEIDHGIHGFGFRKDPRIEEIIGQRPNARQDLAVALGIKPDQISFTQEEALREGVVYHWGDLILRDLDPTSNSTFPAYVRGNVLFGFSSAQGRKLPKYIGGSLSLDSLEKPDGLVLPERIGGNLSLTQLTSAKGLRFTDVGGSLLLTRLENASGLQLGNVGDNIHLGGLFNADDLVIPESFTSQLIIDWKLQLPENVRNQTRFTVKKLFPKH